MISTLLRHHLVQVMFKFVVQTFKVKFTLHIAVVFLRWSEWGNFAGFLNWKVFSLPSNFCSTCSCSKFFSGKTMVAVVHTEMYNESKTRKVINISWNFLPFFALPPQNIFFVIRIRIDLNVEREMEKSGNCNTGMK